MTNIDKAIAGGRESIEDELRRQEAIYNEQLRKRYSSETPNRSRFAIASHMTKTSHKINRLIDALARFECDMAFGDPLGNGCRCTRPAGHVGGHRGVVVAEAS
jgi:hypothetical protein